MHRKTKLASPVADTEFFAHLRIPRDWSHERVGRKVADALKQYRAVHVTVDVIPGPNRFFWDTVTAYIGKRMPVDEDAQTGRQTSAIWTDIAYNPDAPFTFRHSNQSQPLHTDGAYLSAPPPVVFLFCERQAQSGGATLIYDGVELVRLLERESLDLLNRLYNIKVHFSKHSADSGYYGPILEKTGDKPKIAWNFFRVNPRQNGTAKKLASRFHDFLTTNVSMRSLPLRVRLQPGEVVFFHDDRVLHGREKFAAYSTNERVLWKGGLFPNV